MLHHTHSHEGTTIAHLCAEPPSSTWVMMMLWGDRFDPLPPVIWIPSPSVPFRMCIFHMRQPSRWEKMCRESLNLDLDTERGLEEYMWELFSTLLPITTHLYSSSYTGLFAESCHVSCGPSKGCRKKEAAQSRISTQMFPCRAVCSFSWAPQRCCSQCPNPSWSNLWPHAPPPKLKDELCRAAEKQAVVQTPGRAAVTAAGTRLSSHGSIFLSGVVCRIWDIGKKLLQFQIIICQSNISYCTAVVQIVNYKFIHHRE